MDIFKNIKELVVVMNKLAMNSQFYGQLFDFFSKKLRIVVIC
jgi:hypothetical protein